MLIKSLEKGPGLRSEEGDPRVAGGGGVSQVRANSGGGFRN